MTGNPIVIVREVDLLAAGSKRSQEPNGQQSKPGPALCLVTFNRLALGLVGAHGAWTP